MATAPKQKTAYVCQHCGSQQPKWAGKCPNCGTWNSLVEEIIPAASTRPGRGLLYAGARAATVKALAHVETQRVARFVTSDGELNRVLGGGIVPGSVVLVGGEPGIGKSTLMLQVALSLTGRKVLYVSGEESAEQIKLRADRIAPGTSAQVYLLTETEANTLLTQARNLAPDVLIIDSIQTLELSGLDSAPGTVSQVRECAAMLVRYAKESGVPVFLIGHITKEGALAGPKVLEHMVDTVLQFEGDRHLSYRMLRTTKNRFGPSSELGLYEMVGDGLRQVTNPSEVLISQRDTDLSGFTVGVMLEGQRPLLIESQSLVSAATYGTPQRTANGMDGRRLQMLLAVLEKRAGFKLNQHDVFLNIAGGLRIEDPGLDLAICAAIVSSYTDMAVPPDVCFAGEVGLGGEVRAVLRADQRAAEAARLGYKHMFVSQFQKEAIKPIKGLTLRPVSRITEVFSMLFGL